MQALNPSIREVSCQVGEIPGSHNADMSYSGPGRLWNPTLGKSCRDFTSVILGSMVILVTPSPKMKPIS